jgi:predicted component of type VI protein secretion system
MDISVTRLHALIEYEDGKFYLKDQGAKFGTLLLVRSAMELDNFKTWRVQIGRTLLKMKIKF